MLIGYRYVAHWIWRHIVVDTTERLATRWSRFCIRSVGNTSVVPYPYPHELYADLAEGGHFIYEEFGYFNDQDGRTHAEVIGVLNTALAYGYTQTIPSLPTPRDAEVRAFTELAENNKHKGIE